MTAPWTMRRRLRKRCKMEVQVRQKLMKRCNKDSSKEMIRKRYNTEEDEVPMHDSEEENLIL